MLIAKIAWSNRYTVIFCPWFATPAGFFSIYPVYPPWPSHPLTDIIAINLFWSFVLRFTCLNTWSPFWWNIFMDITDWCSFSVINTLHADVLVPWNARTYVGKDGDDKGRGPYSYMLSTARIYCLTPWSLDDFNVIYISNFYSEFNILRPGQMDAISQTTFSNAFSWMEMFEFRLKCHWSLCPRVQLTIFQQWFR